MDIYDIPAIQDKKIILVCDDSKTTLHSLKSALSNYYHVITAASGYEALSFAILYCPDIILMDIMMYGMNGFETIIKLKSNMITKEIPVIFLSGLEESKYKEKGFELGAEEYLSKPFNMSDVIEKIEIVLTKRSGENERKL